VDRAITAEAATTAVRQAAATAEAEVHQAEATAAVAATAEVRPVAADSITSTKTAKMCAQY
jgi:hypothetical protein